MAKKKNKSGWVSMVSSIGNADIKKNKKRFKKHGNKSPSMPSDSKTWLHIYGLHVDQSADFPGFVTEFSDSYTSNWSQESVYGRMDPVPIFESTNRSISVGFKIVPSSLGHADYLGQELNTLIQLLYPKYSRQSGVNLLNSAPLFRIKFSNFISKNHFGIGSSDLNGLAGYITSLNATPDLDAGLIATKTNHFPKVWNISFTFNVLHEETPGWSDSNGFMITSQDYPYGGADRLAKELQVRENYSETPGPQASVDIKNNNRDVPQGQLAQGTSSTNLKDQVDKFQAGVILSNQGIV